MSTRVRFVTTPGLYRRDFIAATGSLVLVGCGGPPLTDEPPGYAPEWELEDMQPASARYGERYGLEEFQGSAILVALLAGGCAACQGIVSALDPLLEAWRGEGMNVAFCAINEASDENPELLAERCTFPVFQDTPTANAWELHDGARDYIFVYGDNYRLVERFPPGFEPNGNPTTEEGQANLKAALGRGLSG